MKNLALHWKIIIGMLLGVIYGISAHTLGFNDFTSDWIKPWGVIFVNLLKLIAVPLVFASLIKGVASLSDITRLSKIGSRTVLLYLFSTVLSVSIGLFLVNTFKPGNSFSEEKKYELREKYSSKADLKINDAKSVEENGPLQFVVDIVPVNIISSASENKNMLQIIFFAILFGISIIVIPDEKTIYVRGFFDGINDIILYIVDLIMKFAPYGVFALLASLVVDFGASIDLFLALGYYSLTVSFGLLLMIFVVYPLLLKLFTKVNYFSFFKAISPAQMLAFSTSSSAATLPVTMDRCENNVGVSKEVSSFVLPLGATINMDGTAIMQGLATMFVASVALYDLSLVDYMQIVLLAIVASIGTAAVPSAGIITLTLILGSLGLGLEAIGLILAVDRILDMLRTSINVCGDAAVACVVANSEELLDKDLFNK